MKFNEKSNKNSINSNNKFDLIKNYTKFNNNFQNENSKININYNNDKNINKMNVDPRLELTLKYLDILSTLDIFVNNCISFNDLLLLSKKDLIELGFSLVERNRIFNFSQEYKNFGVKYNISEINDFFNKYENLNISLVTNNNYNKYNIKKKESNNENINHNYINNNYNNKLILEKNKISLNSEKLKDKTKSITNQNQKKNNIYLIHDKNNKYLINKNKLNISSNINQKYLNNNNNNIYQSRDTNYQDSMNSNQINNKNNLLNSSKLVRQNSKLSKNSSYSKSSKSRFVTIPKSFITGGSSGSIIQKYQNITDEIDNYFKKYNEYKEQKKNRMKKYELISASYKRKNNNYNYNNPVMNNNMIKNNKINDNFEGENINKNREDEINKKLSELQKRKKELKDKLNLVCERENKKLMIIKFLEEEDK